MTSRILSLILVSLLPAPPAFAQSTAQAPRPNIVLMMADDQGWGETGYNGHPQVKTPVLDELSRTALRLDRFYAASPVCSPTRASVMTGRHANRSGAFAPNWSTRPEEITLAQIVKQAGYRTGHFGKWHLGAVKQDSPLNPNRMGFDEYLSHDNFLKHPAPQRPIDGISLRSLIFDGAMKERPSPIGFWRYAAQGENKHGRWVREELARGTTPTTKQANILFNNFKHPVAKTSDFGGDAAWTENRFKLVTGQARGGAARTELFDLAADPKETTDVAAQHPEDVKRMRAALETWQRSVERSLSGADY